MNPVDMESKPCPTTINGSSLRLRKEEKMETKTSTGSTVSNVSSLVPPADHNLREIWLAGGCFWGLEAYMERLKGVIYTNVGYANGNTENPTYEQVCNKNTGHAETVYVIYDPRQIDLRKLLSYFFKVIDPTTLNRQGNDRGPQYRSGIYYKEPSEKLIIDQVIADEQKKYPATIVVEVLPLRNYYAAEEYHQKYLKKNPHGYCHIDINSLDNDPSAKGNDLIAERKQPYTRPPKEEIRQNLTPLQFRVTQSNGTEPPFANEFVDNHQAGLYVDIVTGAPLCSSRDKFDSGSGWPSYTQPIAPDAVVRKADNSLFDHRIEVRSRYGDSHLGHVFEDGPKDKGGLRYCMNSAAMRFIPLEKMKEEGYGDYIPLVK
jgi:peptide methionine sulfoxide reductase msrA/msrB